MVLATPHGDDVILCQITSQTRFDPYSLALDPATSLQAGLNQSSRVRPNRLFAAKETIIAYLAGKIAATKLDEVINRLVIILKQLMNWRP